MKNKKKLIFKYLINKVSIIVFSIIAVLVTLEVNYFFTNQLEYKYEVDFDHSRYFIKYKFSFLRKFYYYNLNSKLNMNVDITVAMNCNNLGADVMDSTSRDILTDQSISMEDTWFEMSPKQLEHFNHVSSHYNQIRNHYHAIHSVLWFNEKNYGFLSLNI